MLDHIDIQQIQKGIEFQINKDFTNLERTYERLLVKHEKILS